MRHVLLVLFCLLAPQVLAAEDSLDIPVCTLGAPDTKFIQSLGDWYAINDSRYRVFCVSPGDYGELGEIKLTAGGSAEAPRFILYHGAATGHPAQMAEEERAVISGLDIEGAWWVIDRLTIRGEGAFVTVRGDDNRLNRVLVEGGGGGAGQVKLAGGDRAAIVDSVLRETAQEADHDYHCIKVIQPASGVRLVGNEIYNCAGDGLQVDGSGGMLIEDNDFYVTPDLYTDCSGNPDEAGNCSCAENAIDIKSTTDAEDPPPDAWVRIRNNRFWGFRETDVTCSGTGSSGDAIVIHFEGAYVRVEGNVFFDSDYGFNTPNRQAHDLYVVDNIFARMFYSAMTGLYKSSDGTFVNNTVVDSGGGIEDNDQSHRFVCNVFINAGIVDINGSSDFNAYYNSEPVRALGEHDLVFETAEDARHRAYDFMIRRHTVPTDVSLPNALATEASPHYQNCPSP